MVPSVQTGQDSLDLDEDEKPGSLEGFHWEGISVTPGGSLRKRSLSESSVVTDKTSVYSLFVDAPKATRRVQSGASGHQPADSRATPDHTSLTSTQQLLPVKSEQDVELPGERNSAQAGKQDAGERNRELQVATPTGLGAVPGSVAADGATDSSYTSGGELNDTQAMGKKRRAGDLPSPEVSGLERKNKRRKLKSKKERSQVDQLLSMSLREEELNRSLHGLDGSLLQARTTLQSAYLEVQRLLVVKQQVHVHSACLLGSIPVNTISITSLFSPETYDPTGLSAQHPGCSAATTNTSADLGSKTKAPLIPNRDSPNTATPVPQSTPPYHPGAAIPDSSIKQEPSSPAKDEAMTLSRPEGPGGHVTTTLGQAHHTAQASGTPGLPLAGSPSTLQKCSGKELRAGGEQLDPENPGNKRKKKFRKKKCARVAQEPENSDTEQDSHVAQPVRKSRNSKKPSKPKVSTSSWQGPEGSSVAREQREMADCDFSLEVVEVAKPQLEVVAVDSLESGDDKPESLAQQQQPGHGLGTPETPTNAGYNEVSSTSEMGTSFTDDIERSVAETQTTVSSLLKSSKNTSEVSSEAGDDEEGPTEGAFEGHQGAVNDVQIHNGHLYTCSADKTVRVYDLVSRQCVGTFEGHSTKVNCLLIVQTHGTFARLYTGSSDQIIRCYNVESRECVEQFVLSDRVLSLHNRWRMLYAGLANGSVITFSVKSNRQLDVFECHGPRAVSCLSSAQEGSRRLLLVGSYDCTISVRDAKNGLLLRTLEGHTKTVLCMKVVNDLVFSGSSDHSVHAHNIHTGELVRIYKGHSHAVTVVSILGKVMVTACLDKMVRVYELNSHDRLQVYGGHKDMVMCMTIHKSMIYTGCYDGSVQAVRLNLMQNFRCWWQGCCLIFGVREHLRQHLLAEHSGPSLQNLKCRWRNCNAFFTVKQRTKQVRTGSPARHPPPDPARPGRECVRVDFGGGLRL
uniref:C2H2-type domain-containing protein n=1 Tax=Callorhinchus milii TaxID=7868 RepID=A0A4W3JPS1_CALMI